jgi:RES domain-containing protein
VVERRARDLELLDVLDAHAGVSFSGDVWRVVREERDVLQGYPAGARWDPGSFDVLYTALAPEGALEEIHFHLSRQPVFPSKIRSVLHRITVQTKRTLRLADLQAIEALGVTAETYVSLDYGRCQEIGDAAAFLGFDGVLAPSARWPCQNLVLFSDSYAPGDLQVVESSPVDWADWRSRRLELRKSGGRADRAGSQAGPSA